MSLKSIELQVALPRTQEAGKLQDQLQQRGQNLQDHLAANMTKDQEKKRQQVGKNEQTEKNKLNADEEKQQQREQHQNKKKRSPKQVEEKQHHPYKGNLIDIEG